MLVHRVDLLRVFLCDDMALGFEGGGQLLADFEGLGHEAPPEDKFKRFEALLAADQSPDFRRNDLGDARVGFGLGQVRYFEALRFEGLDGGHDECAEMFFVLSDNEALLDEA